MQMGLVFRVELIASSFLHLISKRVRLDAAVRAFLLYSKNPRLRACLHGVGDPGLVGLVSFVFTLWKTQNKRNLPH